MLQHENAHRATEDHDTSGGPDLHGARWLAVKILTRIDQRNAYLDKLLQRELSSTTLVDADRRLLNELATGVLRWQGSLDWVLSRFFHGEFGRFHPIVLNALRVALYQILYLDRIPHSAAVNESVEIVKRTKGAKPASVVNGVLRAILRKLDAIPWPDRDEDAVKWLSVTAAHPLWMARRWSERYGVDETALLMAANNRRPRLALRVNTARASVDQVRVHLEGRGNPPEPSRFVETMVVVDGLAAIGGDAAFKNGWFSIQDEGAALAARLAGARPGMRVIDLCAAPGGKTTAMAEAMAGSGTVVAVDRYEAKLRLVDEAVERLGLGAMIECVEGDATTIDLEAADVVLVDAPCSGLGVLAKKPDIKWKRTEEEIREMTVLQRRLLDHAATLVRPSGCLVYTTCTIEPEENELMVREFLKRHPEFALVPATSLLPPEVVDDEGYLRTLPHVHGIDGTFGARLQRIA